MKLPIFEKFSGLNREFHPEILPIFGIPEFKSTLKPREFQVEGVSLLSLKMSVYLKLSHFEGELQTERFPRLFHSKNLDYFKIAGILIWKSFTFVQKYTQFLELSHSEHNANRGNFEIKGVSLLSKICSYFWNSKNRKYFRTAGIQVEGVSFLSVKLSVL